MKIVAISFTAQGAKTAKLVKDGLADQNSQDVQCTCWTMKKGLPEELGQLVQTGLADWTEAVFARAEALLFVGATGIAVRAIAPYLKSKDMDPAVIVVDERGIHVISLLSGHIGGANELTRSIARILSAHPVITTATDINGLFAVDQWAAERGLYINDLKLAKEVAARQLDDQSVGFVSDVPVSGEVPKGLVCCRSDGTMGDHPEERPRLGIAVTCRKNYRPFPKTLQLVPPIVILGMGCRKDIATENVTALLRVVLDQTDLHEKALAQIASIDLKKDEKALLAVAAQLEIPFVTYPAAALAQVKGDFSPSAFVKSVTGVDNVCERAAILASQHGQLFLKKQARDGVTAALARQNIELKF